MLQQDEPDDYVIATGETHTVREFLEEVFSHAGLDVDKHLYIDPRLFRPHEVPYLLGNPEKAKKILENIATKSKEKKDVILELANLVGENINTAFNKITYICLSS